jgi:2-keto-4-pentenoate hydratase/2-oxohepta-3-ene-1,7-dioic acid hydratase in catechol pathway
MRLASFLRGETPSLGLVLGEKVLAVDCVAQLDPDRWGLLAGAEDVSPLWTEAGGKLLCELNSMLAASGIPQGWEEYCEAVSLCRWLPPVASPEKIICIGVNYKGHAAETGAKIPEVPVLFGKFNTALVGASSPVILPSISSQVDYEAELAVVIGKRAKRVSLAEASRVIGGYMIMNDVSARDWQFRAKQWLTGKSFDTFAPAGPWLVTPDEIPNPHDLGIRLALNGLIMQDSNTRDLIFGIPDLISHISRIFTLKPGDIISTGTPPGVGYVRNPPVFLRDGDFVEISIDGIGTLKHSCIAES